MSEKQIKNAIEDAEKVVPLEHPRFTLVRFDDVKFSTEASYLVKDLLPQEGLVVIWGPPKCGKSFWTFDITMHIALGWEYRSRRVRQGPVVYIACEGHKGFECRIEAFRQHRLSEGASGGPFHLLRTTLDLVSECPALIKDITGQEPAPTVVVLDTLNRTLRGSESNDEDMAAYIQAADAIRDAFNCAVIIVHHCGVDASRPRGHTSLQGAADAQLAVKRESDGTIRTVVEWFKDGEEGAEIFSRLEQVEVGIDDFDDPITSCIVTPVQNTARPKRLTGKAKEGYEILCDALIDLGELAPFSRHIPQGVQVVKVEQWRTWLMKAGTINASGNYREQFRRIRDKLRAAGAVGEWDGMVWIVTSSHAVTETSQHPAVPVTSRHTPLTGCDGDGPLGGDR